MRRLWPREVRGCYYVSTIFNAAAPRRLAVISPLLAVGLLAGGCMSSPTYGTGVTANEQLLTDVSSIVSIKPPKREAIDYKPRPDLVRPAHGQAAELPAPQDKVATAQNPDWPESPEQRRKRLRDEADANVDNQFYRPPIVNDVSGGGGSDYTRTAAGSSAKAAESGIRPAGQAQIERREVQKRLADSRQGSATQRKYLSEPPLDYRQPSATAPTDDLGEDELKKQRRAKKLATPPKQIRDYIPWL